jgi:hypothetical protein
MKIIAHRRNTLEELRLTPPEMGIEVDIRSFGNKLAMHHDPFVDGPSFEEWLSEYRHGTLILNVKEEGLESRLIDLMEQRNIRDYFFLDQSFPFLIKYAKLGVRRCAVRVSEYESIETASSLAGLIDWIWVDCFTKFPLSEADGVRLKQMGFKLCLVSPELQGRHGASEIPTLRRLLLERGIAADAVCTKYPERWTAQID